MLQCSSWCTCSEGKWLQQQGLQNFCADWTGCSAGGRKNLPAPEKYEKSIAYWNMQVHSLQNFGPDWDLQVAGKICLHLQRVKKQKKAKICSCKEGKNKHLPRLFFSSSDFAPSWGARWALPGKIYAVVKICDKKTQGIKTIQDLCCKCKV